MSVQNHNEGNLKVLNKYRLYFMENWQFGSYYIYMYDSSESFPVENMLSSLKDCCYRSTED